MYSRINVVGTSGSGKSTFAKRLSDKLNIEYIELDSLFWKDDWQFCNDNELKNKIEISTSKDSWVLDGNYDRMSEFKWKNVQTIIWLDYPFYLVFYRVFKRSISRMLNPIPLWGTNNIESFSLTFLNKDSIIWWMITSYPKMKKRYSNLFETNKCFNLIRLRSPKEAENFLRNNFLL